MQFNKYTYIHTYMGASETKTSDRVYAYRIPTYSIYSALGFTNQSPKWTQLKEMAVLYRTALYICSIHPDGHVSYPNNSNSLTYEMKRNPRNSLQAARYPANKALGQKAHAAASFVKFDPNHHHGKCTSAHYEAHTSRLEHKKHARNLCAQMTDFSLPDARHGRPFLQSSKKVPGPRRTGGSV